MKALVLLIFINMLTACTHIYKLPRNSELKNISPEKEQVLLAVKVTSVLSTSLYPGSENCPPDTCIPMHFWHLYEAEVLGVLHGKSDLKHIRFANLQHTLYVPEITNEWYVFLDKFEDHQLVEKLNVEYYVVEHDSFMFHDN